MKSSELSPELSPHNSFTASIIVHYTGMVLGKADKTQSFFCHGKNVTFPQKPILYFWLKKVDMLSSSFVGLI